MAEHLAAGQGVVSPYPPHHLSVARMPGLVALLAMSLMAFGSWQPVLWLQVFADLLTAAFIGILIARRLGWRWGVVGVWTYSLLPAAFGWCAVLGTETLTTMLLTAAAVLVGQPGIGAICGAGLALAAAAYIRPDALVFLPALLIWSPLPRMQRLWSIAVVALALAPWAVRNGLVAGTWTPLPPRYVAMAEGRPATHLLEWMAAWNVQPKLVQPVLFRYPPDLAQLPDTAFASTADREIVARLLQRARQRVAAGQPALTHEDDAVFVELRDRLVASQSLPLRTVIAVRQGAAGWLTSRTEVLGAWPKPAWALAVAAYGICLLLALASLPIWRTCALGLPIYVILSRSSVIPLARVGLEPRYTIEALPMLVVMAVCGGWIIFHWVRPRLPARSGSA
jgi:hypothetical protein